MILVRLGSDCSTVVECKPDNREVLGSIPDRCWAFSLYALSNASLIRSLEEEKHDFFPIKNEKTET